MGIGHWASTVIENEPCCEGQGARKVQGEAGERARVDRAGLGKRGRARATSEGRSGGMG